MLYVMMLFLCEFSSCLINIVTVALLLCAHNSECDVWVCWLLLSAWHKIDSLSFSEEQPLFLNRQTASLEKNLKGRPLVFLSRPKMADVPDAILCFLVVFWGAESQPCIQSEAAGGSHICRHLCVYLRLRSSSQPTQG